MNETLRRNANLVDSLGSALRSGEHGLNTVPALLERVVEEESWREFVTKRGELVEHKRFADFVATPPLKGLGGDMDLVRRVVKGTPAEDALNRQLEKDGRQGARTDLVSNIHEVERPAGTTKDAALRRLRKDAPALHEQVLAGALSAHAAMIEAGFRPKTFTVRADRPESVARALRKHLTAEQIAELRTLLDEYPEGA